ncbi:meiosis-specific nuclear structural protein 1-like [Rana temporaria]|uniref:meiosis-specific nuclear structural protein 1-like n=1 Tax=Rana temporaria TaxID=8407 RepID=UPI001AAC535D|nr:meiosis-specific nuclear structural protein 1-like [Rana temporaria]
MNRTTTRGVTSKPTKNNSGNSSIQQYMTQEGSLKSPGLAKKIDKKKNESKKGVSSMESSKGEITIESEQELHNLEEQVQDMQPPTKAEMNTMLLRMENVIRTEINKVRTDLGGLRERVEETEKKIEEQDQEINYLKKQVRALSDSQRLAAYRIEDQENRNRRQNLRIRAIVEEKEEDLRTIMNTIFNPLLERPVQSKPLKIERVHRVGNPQQIERYGPRDVIVRFRNYVDKAEIWGRLRGKSLRYRDIELQIFSDLSKETLARRRHLKPLLDLMRAHNIKYQWGFPACLIGIKGNPALPLILVAAPVCPRYSGNRVEKKRYLRRLQDEEQERQMEDAIQHAEETKRLKELQLEQEERMATELARIKQEKLKDEKLRQQIRENSLELRELEQKLKSAYLTRERAAQVAEKEVVKYEKIKRESEIARKMKEEHERASEEELAKETRRYHEKLHYQKELETQLEEKEIKRQEAYQEFLREKILVDEIVRKIYEEDQTERQLKLEKTTATKRYIEEFKEQQKTWRKLEKEKMEAENLRIRSFANMQQRREEDRMVQIREREEKKKAIQDSLVEHIHREQQQRDELDQMREELYLEEQAEQARQREIEELEKKIRQRLELQRTFEEQMAFKQIVQQAAKEEEEAFRQAMLAKFAEDDRIEQMNAQKRRMKQLEHKRAVEKLLEDRHQQFIADKERELLEREEEEKREAFRRAIIEEERQKLLKQHATQLLGYLPKVIFKGEEDLNMFDEEFRKTFQKRSADMFSDDGWGS